MAQYELTALREFDPNSTKFTPWATYIPRRRMPFKTHATRPVALGCVASGGDYAILYERVGDRWVERVRKCPDDHQGRCDVCHHSTIEPSALGVRNRSRYLGDNTVDTGMFVWRRGRGRRITEPLTMLFVCRLCWPHYR